MDIVDVLKLFGAPSVVLCGLSAYLGKVWANRISVKDNAKIQAEIEELKSEFGQKLAKLNASNEPKVHVSKIQYEREFSSYADIWELIPQINDELKIINNNKGSFEFYKKHFLKLSTLNSKLSDNISSLYPFIDAKVYISALDCTNCVSENYPSFNDHLDYLESKANDLNTPSLSKEDEHGKSVKEVCDKHHKSGVKLAKLIKARNEQMVVLQSAT